MTSDIINKRPKQHKNLLQLPTVELLKRFGEGNATPGSGSAAALMALLASSIICALAKLSIPSLTKKAAAEESSGKESLIRKQVETARDIVRKLEKEVEPRLNYLFEDDSRKFQDAIDARKNRDKTTENHSKELYKERALKKLLEANEILLEIADLSFKVCDHGLSIWLIGLKYAKGDAGAGINGSLAAITTCLQVAYVNVQTLAKEKDQTEARKAKLACDEIQTKLLEKRQKFEIASQDFYDEISRNIR